MLYFFPANDKTKPIYFGSRGSQFNNEEILQWLRKVVTLPFRGSFDSQYYVGFVGRTKHQMKVIARARKGPENSFVVANTLFTSDLQGIEQLQGLVEAGESPVFISSARGATLF